MLKDFEIDTIKEYIPEFLRYNQSFIDLVIYFIESNNLNVEDFHRLEDLVDVNKAGIDFIKYLADTVKIYPNNDYLAQDSHYLEIDYLNNLYKNVIKKYAFDYIKKSSYMNFVTMYLREDEDFLVFLALLISQFNVSLENIEKFTDLIDPEKVPMGFIEELGAYVDYHYVVNADDDFNREIITRMQSIYEQRGTEHSITMAAVHGDNAGWVGGDIFIPGYDISRDSATLTVASDLVFRHSRSRHSGLDFFSSGNIYRPGVLILNLPYVNDDIKKAVYNVTPAGVKYVFASLSTFGPDDIADMGNFNELTFGKFFRVKKLPQDPERKDMAAPSNMEITVNIYCQSNIYDALIHSGGKAKRFHSGMMMVSDETEKHEYLGASMLNSVELERPFSANPEINYIQSGSGELLDTVDRSTTEHLHRPIDLINVDLQKVKNVLLSARRSSFSGARSGRNGTTFIRERYDVLDDVTGYSYNVCVSDDGISFVKNSDVLGTERSYVQLSDTVRNKVYGIGISDGSGYIEEIDIPKVAVPNRIALKDASEDEFYKVFCDKGRLYYAVQNIDGSAASRLGKMSGSITNDIITMTQEKEITPQDFFYGISAIKDVKNGGLMSPFFVNDFGYQRFDYYNGEWLEHTEFNIDPYSPPSNHFDGMYWTILEPFEDEELVWDPVEEVLEEFDNV